MLLYPICSYIKLLLYPIITVLSNFSNKITNFHVSGSRLLQLLVLHYLQHFFGFRVVPTNYAHPGTPMPQRNFLTNHDLGMSWGVLGTPWGYFWKSSFRFWKRSIFPGFWGRKLHFFQKNGIFPRYFEYSACSGNVSRCFRCPNGILLRPNGHNLKKVSIFRNFGDKKTIF